MQPNALLIYKTEFMMRLNLFDESNIATNGLNVALFDKDDLALPRADVGDVLLLRTVMVSRYGKGPIRPLTGLTGRSV